MKKNLLISLASAALLTSVAHAGQVSMSDSDLDAIAGKDNAAAFASTNINVTLSAGKNDVQVGFYQWDDNHSADTSNEKGGTTANGDSSNVQAGVTALNNIFGWGWADQIDTTVGGSVTAAYDSESWCAMFVGGY